MLYMVWPEYQESSRCTCCFEFCPEDGVNSSGRGLHNLPVEWKGAKKKKNIYIVW